MDPICFHIGSRPIYWYGVLVALAFLAAVGNWTVLGKKTHRPEGFGSELGFWIMLSGILGARIAYIFANLDVYMAHPIEMVRLDKGGLIFYGSFFAAAVCVTVLARLHKEPVMQLADFTITGMPVAHAIGRIGCFINGCCYGSVTTVPWGVWTQDAVRHPTQLYESVFNLLVYGLLLWFFPRRKQNGQVLALYLLTYPVGRFLLEFVRGDERLHWLELDVAQEISLGLFVIGVALWFGLWAKTKKANG
jgi:phosphatidylglycerol---prolipoprotein diacylglyceryl transferase